MPTVRCYTLSDQKGLLKLYAAEIHPKFLSKRLEAFDWITLSNPKDGNIGNWFVMEQEGRIIGYWGRMPINLYIHGKPSDAFFSHEALVDSSMRRQGIARGLVEKIENEAPSLLLSLWHNHSIYSLLVRRGWKALYFRPFLKILNFRSMLRNRIRRNPSSVIPLIGMWLWQTAKGVKYSCPQGAEIRIREVEKFDEQFDQFFSHIACKFPAIVERSSKVLRWKYGDIPYIKYEKLKAERNGEICGYSVLRIDNRGDNKKGIIVDFLVSPDDSWTFHLLMSRSIDLFKIQNVDFVECLFTYSGFKTLALKHGFIPGRLREVNSLLLKNTQGLLNASLLESLGCWHITFGDSDGDMWTGTKG